MNYGKDTAEQECSEIWRRVGRRSMSANEIQHGGDHYRRGGDYQHWDFVWDTSLDYFQGCASKYVSRCRFKGKPQEDLNKAAHYCQKAAELSQPTTVIGLSSVFEPDTLWRFAIANDLTLHEVEALWYICSRNWEAAQRKIKQLMSLSL